MLARVGEKLDSEFVSLGHSGPQHLRIVGGPQALRLDPGQDQQERRRRPAVRQPAQPGPHHAAQPGPHRGGQPDHRGADLDRRPGALAARQQRPRDRAPGPPGPREHRHRRRPPHPHRHHVPRPAAARARRLPSCRTPAAATSAPAPSSRTCRRCKAFGLDVAATHGFYEATVEAGREPTRADRAHRARRHRHRERRCWRRPATPGTTVIRNASPNYMVQDLCFFLQALGVQIDGIGTTTLTRHRRARHRHGHRVLPVRGPDRGDEPDRRGGRHRVDDHHRAGADRVPRDRAGHARGDGPEVRHHRRSTARATATPAWSTSPSTPARSRRRSTRSPRCRSPA